MLYLTFSKTSGIYRDLRGFEFHRSVRWSIILSILRHSEHLKWFWK